MDHSSTYGTYGRCVMSIPSTAIRRHPERALAAPAAAAILDAALVAHVGTIEDGWPRVIPLTFLYGNGSIYLHGAHASRTIKALAAGTPACVEVTLVDGLIASKTAESHSVNYRSVVCYGRGRLVQDETVRRDIFERLIGRYFAGRTAGVDYHPLTEREMKAVALVEVVIEAISAKARSGGPRGVHDEDETVYGSAFIAEVPTAS